MKISVSLRHGIVSKEILAISWEFQKMNIRSIQRDDYTCRLFCPLIDLYVNEKHFL